MRKAEDILKNLAFNKDAPESTKQAFLKNLQRALAESHKAEVVPVSKHKFDSAIKFKARLKEVQMSFDLGVAEYRPKKHTS